MVTTYSKNQADEAKILLFFNFSYVAYTCTNGIYIERIVDQTFQCFTCLDFTYPNQNPSKKNY